MFRKLHDPDLSVVIDIDGVKAPAEPGETVAAVLLRQVDPTCRLTAVSRSRRAPYCMMGVCFECLAQVDGLSSVQTCLTEVRAGMRVSRQLDKPEVDS